MGSMHTSNLFAAAQHCLAAVDPDEKCRLTRQFAAAMRAGDLTLDDSSAPVETIGSPGRPERPHLIEPRQLAQRGLGSAEGRAALVHAIAHIEFNAINLAWDAVYRFRGMPEEFYADWAGVADDEARHFTLLRDRLAELGYHYGDFDAHNGLWEMAVVTADSCLERMALVPRVLEARGLDVTPGMILRLRSVADNATADILEIILSEEVAHVAAGSRWFSWCCAKANLDAESTFAGLLESHMRGSLRGPFNIDARLSAGFSEAELAHIGAFGG